MKAEPSILTISEMADILRCHQTTLYRLVKKGQIPHFRVEFDIRFNRETVYAADCLEALFTGERTGDGELSEEAHVALMGIAEHMQRFASLYPVNRE